MEDFKEVYGDMDLKQKLKRMVAEWEAYASATAEGSTCRYCRRNIEDATYWEGEARAHKERALWLVTEVYKGLDGTAKAGKGEKK